MSFLSGVSDGFQYTMDFAASPDLPALPLS